MSPLIVFVIFVWSVVNLGLKPITYSVWNSKEVRTTPYRIIYKTEVGGVRQSISITSHVINKQGTRNEVFI